MESASKEPTTGEETTGKEITGKGPAALLVKRSRGRPRKNPIITVFL